MDKNSYSKSPKVTDKPGLWQKIMKNVKFQGNIPSTTKNPTTIPDSTEQHKDAKRTTETIEKNPDSAEQREGTKRVTEAIENLKDQALDVTDNMALRPATRIVCDSNHIEGQQINVIDKRDRNSVELNFKLKALPKTITSSIAELKSKTDNKPTSITTLTGIVLRPGTINYEKTSSDYSYTLCDAFVYEKNGVKVSIADPTSKEGDRWSISHSCNSSGLVRTAMDLVKIEVPSDTPPETIEQTLDEIMSKDLGVPNALEEVPENAEKEYKQARYKWQHAITEDLTPEQIEQAEKLTRQEVCPGYTTLVEPGIHKKYLEKYGEDVRAIHTLHAKDAASIHKILTRGLISTTERYSRGFTRPGMSSNIDMDTGGADNAFTRIANAEQRKKVIGITIIFKPEIFDRTDWFSYEKDSYGSTDEELFPERLSPDEIFAKVTDPDNPYPRQNEQMFRTGIGAEYIESIEIDDPLYNDIISGLKSQGLKEINGQPIEKIVVPRNDLSSDQLSYYHQKFDDLWHNYYNKE